MEKLQINSDSAGRLKNRSNISKKDFDDEKKLWRKIKIKKIIKLIKFDL